ncbi:hypothetical protein QBC38DRAFT_501027 [Podospora fimiseda]|uniref:Apple domain-containing protein n=1 Tax=Podospora fimiseda TaxID=252190 RepID=A0AAN7H1H4_9PEZI|nr:hypothetical protein QBC38DRAFT_501027 [Podospora fimiseda]
MDAPEAVPPTRSKSLSNIWRRGLIQTPPPFSPGAFSPRVFSFNRRHGRLYDFYTSEKDSEFDDKENKEVRILGFRRATFFLGLSLAIVVLIAIIGGGVGGTMAVAKARSEGICEPTLQPTTNTPPTRLPLPTPASGTLTAASITVPTTGLLDFDCAQVANNRQVVTLGTKSWGFDVQCMVDYLGPGVDLTGMTTYRFEDCIRACAIYNKIARNNTCLGVHFNANLTTILPRVHGNCWLKAYLPQVTAELNLAAVASLVYSPQF